MAVVCSAVVLPLLLWGLYREEPPPPAERRRRGFVGLPDPADITHQRFRIVWRGYDPAEVDAHLDELADAFADLLAVAPHGVVQAAHQRALARHGLAAPSAPPAGGDDTLFRPPAVDHHEPTPVEPSVTAADPEREPLRTAAALGLLRSRHQAG